MIEIKNVSKTYGGKKEKALNNVSLTFPRGEIVGLFGENGAGKTTLMKCVLGFLKCEGEITLDGAPITRENIAKLSFATSEHSFLPELTPKDHFEFYREHFPNVSEKRFNALMEFFELPMKRKVSSYSVGQKNQFEVIMALCQGADYIIMDEPFAGNDVFNREDFYKVLLGILEPHETILLSTHLLEEVEPIISRAILLHKGQVIGDTSTEALEEQGLGLMQYVKQCYNYRSDRVGKALRELTGEEG